ncbi:hypothetical protein LPB137_07965 [Poseidonibacter parvus]|uniref:Uncharacterized protein n=1 Tax=Poseidonibacter parvus TaxID=1850254 RepID=A0A1P8KMK4_9BACT|nr:hypothetical protein [Poseidonibacter parvus]APW65792.1 hypothetical protein LPB137_07965 [Poseidonibacter parvus]
MISKSKKYFTIFGILAATVDKKMQSLNCMIDAILDSFLPKILKILLAKELKPINLDSTNKI